MQKLDQRNVRDSASDARLLVRCTGCRVAALAPRRALTAFGWRFTDGRGVCPRCAPRAPVAAEISLEVFFRPFEP
jgi:hypothetical protein